MCQSKKHLEYEDSPRCPIFHIRLKLSGFQGRIIQRRNTTPQTCRHCYDLSHTHARPPCCLHPLSTPVALYNPVLGLRIHTAMTAIHLFGTLSQWEEHSMRPCYAMLCIATGMTISCTVTQYLTTAIFFLFGTSIFKPLLGNIVCWIPHTHASPSLPFPSFFPDDCKDPHWLDC